MPAATTKPHVHLPVSRTTTATERDSDEPLETREICEEIALKLAEHPKSIYVTETRENKRLSLVVHCHPDDIGQMVGKRASCLKALNDILTRCEWRNHTVVTVDVARPGNTSPQGDNHA